MRIARRTRGLGSSITVIGHGLARSGRRRLVVVPRHVVMLVSLRGHHPVANDATGRARTQEREQSEIQQVSSNPTMTRHVDSDGCRTGRFSRISTFWPSPGAIEGILSDVGVTPGTLSRTRPRRGRPTAHRRYGDTQQRARRAISDTSRSQPATRPHGQLGCPASGDPSRRHSGGSSSSNSAAALRALGDKCAYRIVIVSDAWPSNSCTSTGFAPRITRCEAYVCRLCRARHNQ